MGGDVRLLSVIFVCGLDHGKMISLHSGMIGYVESGSGSDKGRIDRRIKNRMYFIDRMRKLVKNINLGRVAIYGKEKSS